MKKRILTMLLAGVLSVTLLAGCGGSKEPAANTEETTEQAAESTQADTGEKHLNMAYHSEIKNLDPATSSWETKRIGVGENLFRINDELQLEPWLADSYEQVDELTWKITLKDGIKFSNGKDLTGEAAKACLDRTCEKNQRAVTMLNIASIEAEGQTLTITTNDVNAALLNNLADLVGTILDVDTLEGENAIPVGTGPFVIASMEEGKMELVANKDYWDGVPKLDSVTIKYILDGNAQAMALDNGEVDLAFQLPTENIIQFMDSDKITVTSNTGSRSQILYFDYTNEFLADHSVREAISSAIDREAFANIINKGNSEAATAIFPVSFSYGKVPGVSYDVEHAKKLLADAGYTDSDGDGVLDKNGKALSFSLYTYGEHGTLLATFAEAIQASLKEIGIATDIQTNDYDAHTNILKAGGFDLALNSYIMAPVADPQYFCDIMLKTGADYNYGKYSDEKVDELIAQLDQEFDTAKREELAKEIQAVEVEDCGFFTLGHLKYQIAANNKVSGYSTQATEAYILTKDTDIAAE